MKTTTPSIAASPQAPPTGRRRPGRPPGNTRERILDAAIEVLKSDGYAGLTISKIAARSNQNKALVAYHFGSKRGLVEHAGRAIAEMITNEAVKHLEGATRVADVVRGALDGIGSVLASDERIARVYFDLTAVTVVDDELRRAMYEVRNAWAKLFEGYLAATDDGPDAEAAGAAALYVIACLEGLTLERLSSGESANLSAARTMFIESAKTIVGGR
ncbi:MAG: TetR/AcrR family transcriptional regulator [Solirubrobacterales bacterium]